MESRGLDTSKTQKWSTAGSVMVQCAVAALLIAVPMFRPETMPVNVAPPKITVPLLKPVQIVRTVATDAASAATAMRLPAPTSTVERTRGFIFHPSDPVRESELPPIGPAPATMGNDSGSLVAVIGTAAAVAPRVAPQTRDNRPVRISQGVSSGMLLSAITPVYPAIAKVAGVQGSVVIEAVISRAGRVESLNVVSGPAMLRSAALEAVERARYAPYKLNGEPVEVQTVITVVFRLG